MGWRGGAGFTPGELEVMGWRDRAGDDAKFGREGCGGTIKLLGKGQSMEENERVCQAEMLRGKG